MVAHRDRLGALHVREARQRQVRMALGHAHQCLDQFLHREDEAERPVAQEDAQVGGDLVVAAPAGVDALGEVTHVLRERLLDEAVHVLGGIVGRDAVAFPLGSHLLDGRADLLHVALADHPGLAERAGPGVVDLEVGERQHVVDRQALLERLELGVEAAAEAAAPHLSCLAHRPAPCTLEATAPGRP